MTSITTTGSTAKGNSTGSTGTTVDSTRAARKTETAGTDSARNSNGAISLESKDTALGTIKGHGTEYLTGINGNIGVLRDTLNHNFLSSTRISILKAGVENKFGGANFLSNSSKFIFANVCISGANTLKVDDDNFVSDVNTGGGSGDNNSGTASRGINSRGKIDGIGGGTTDTGFGIYFIVTSG